MLSIAPKSRGFEFTIRNIPINSIEPVSYVEENSEFLEEIIQAHEKPPETEDSKFDEDYILPLATLTDLQENLGNLVGLDEEVKTNILNFFSTILPEQNFEKMVENANPILTNIFDKCPNDEEDGNDSIENTSFKSSVLFMIKPLLCRIITEMENKDTDIFKSTQFKEMLLIFRFDIF